MGARSASCGAERTARSRIKNLAMWVGHRLGVLIAGVVITTGCATPASNCVRAEKLYQQSLLGSYLGFDAKECARQATLLCPDTLRYVVRLASTYESEDFVFGSEREYLAGRTAISARQGQPKGAKWQLASVLQDHDGHRDARVRALVLASETAAKGGSVQAMLPWLDLALLMNSRAAREYVMAALIEPELPDPLWWISRVSFGNVKERFLRTLAREDPSNALPYYSLALERARNRDYEEALTLLREGNGRRRVVCYSQIRVPEVSRVAFPRSGDVPRRLWGRTVPLDLFWLPVADEQDQWMGFFLAFGVAMLDLIEHLRDDGMVNEALDFAIEVRSAGVKILAGEPASFLVAATGYGLASDANDLVRAMSTRLKDDSRLSNAEHWQRTLERIGEEIVAKRKGAAEQSLRSGTTPENRSADGLLEAAFYARELHKAFSDFPVVVTAILSQGEAEAEASDSPR